MVAALLAHGADASRLDSRRQSPLFLAVAADRQRLVEALLEASPTVLNQQDAQLRTPLHHAALLGARSVVQLLLRQGARVDIQDIAGKLPLDYAVEEGHMAIVTLLTPRDEEFDFKLPPNGGLVEGGGTEQPPEDNSVVLGAVLGGIASFVMVCTAIACVRRRRAKVANDILPPKLLPPKILVDPMGSEKAYESYLAALDGEESLGPRLGAVGTWSIKAQLRDTRPPRLSHLVQELKDNLVQDTLPLGPRVKRQLSSAGQKKKSSEKESEIDQFVAETTPFETTQIEMIQNNFLKTQVADIPPPLGPPSPLCHSRSLASQKRAREREERRSRSGIYATKIGKIGDADSQGDVQDCGYLNPTRQLTVLSDSPSGLCWPQVPKPAGTPNTPVTIETEVVEDKSNKRESSSSRMERRMKAFKHAV
jgi:hypothetical protein